MDNFYSLDELKLFGFKSIGENVLISKKASIYGADKIVIGNNVRIDDFCILSGNIVFGNNVHISAFTALYGKSGIEFGDYTGCSARCTVYSETDNFSGECMIGAIIPEEYKKVIKGKVVFKNYTQLGANTVVMPNVIVNEGAVTGSMSFVKNDLDSWSINVGIPAKKIKERKKDIIKIIHDYEKSVN